MIVICQLADAHPGDDHGLGGGIATAGIGNNQLHGIRAIGSIRVHGTGYRTGSSIAKVPGAASVIAGGRIVKCSSRSVNDNVIRGI